MLLQNRHLWENFVIGESSAKISRFFPGFPLNFQDISGFSLRGWQNSFLGQEFCTPAGRGTLFGAGERKNPGWPMYKIFRCQQMGVLHDQEWKIPGESWNSINIFYSAPSRLWRGGRTHSLGEEGVGGGQYFGRRQTVLCTLYTYVSTLWVKFSLLCLPLVSYLCNQRCASSRQNLLHQRDGTFAQGRSLNLEQNYKLPHRS